MDGSRSFMAAVASRALVLAAIAALCLATFGHRRIEALALFAGSAIGVAYLFHIVAGFNRLTKGGKGYLPLLTVESLLRVLLAGAAPFIIVGRGPWLGYLTYLAGFVAPLGVAILTYRKQISVECAQTDATNNDTAKSSA